MSMYNMLFGQNEHADLLLAMLHLTKEDVGRFRDVFISNGEIAIYTRNGGNNRDHWEFSYDEYEKGESCPCSGCIITYRLPKHPNYLRDRDDDFDSTYATVYFSIPEPVREIANKLESGTFNPDSRWHEKIDGLKNETLESLRAKYPEICKVLDEIVKKTEGA